MRPHPKYSETDRQHPRGWATCERCGFIWNLYRLQWQFDWRGTRLENTRHLVCPKCLDDPQRQLGTIILPPDPLPLLNARIEKYVIEEDTFRVQMNGQQRFQLDGTARVQSNLQSGFAYDQSLVTEPTQDFEPIETDPNAQQIIINP